MRMTAIVAVTVLLALVGWHLFGAPPWKETPSTVSAATEEGGALAVVTVPELSGAAKAGEALFNANCSACHGKNAAGVDGSGPPLVHRIYEPSHHGDIAFQMAAAQGVRQHHWRFGDMPKVSGVTPADVEQIIVYVRELQRANGID